VQNLPNGTVEAMVQGTADQVDHMLEWLRRGPPGASVQEITTRREYTDKRYIRFEQL
jgi:acylphosphatase